MTPRMCTVGGLLVVEVAVGLDGDPDLLVARADGGVQAEEAAQVQRFGC